MFKWGEESGRLSVGSRGDWMVSGPSVMPIHLWLNFDGKQLYAASGDAAAYAAGQQLGSDWTAVQVGTELRFGFALLRVARDLGQQPAPRARRPGGSKRAAGVPKRLRPEVLAVAIASGVLLVAVLVAALLLRGKSAPSALATPEASAVAAGVASSSTPTSEALPTPGNAPTEPPPAAREQLALVPSPELEPAAPPAQLADAPDAQSANFKPPAAYPQNVANRPIPRIGDKPWLISEEWRQHHERHLRAAGRATAKVIFLGDSITEGWSVAPAYREQFGKYSPVNLGIANDTTQNVLWRIEHGALDGTHPRVVVLMIGINNLAGGFTPEQTSSGVSVILTAIQTRVPEACVLLLGVLPARQEANNPLRQAIKDTNRLLQGLAKPGKVDVHDFGSVLLEPDGSLSKATARDFVHPTAEGFARLSQALAPQLQALLPSE